MAKIDIITKSGMTASDGTTIASGATVKFSSLFMAASTDIKVTPMMYRNRELFEAGFSNIQISEDIMPIDFIINVPEEEYYVLTPAVLYQKVCEYLNTITEGMYEIKIIE